MNEKYGRRGKITVESKTCSKCKQLKPANKFGANKHTRDSLSSWCYSCNSATEKIRRRRRNPTENSRRDFANNLTQHQLSVQAFAMLWLTADGKCENPGCRRNLDLDNRIWAIDHDRSCCPDDRHCRACVRGLLCPQCNTALGLLAESESKAHGLIQYVRTKSTHSRVSDT